MKPLHNIIAFVIVFLLSVWVAMPSLLNLEEGKKFNLGLDLQGGLYIMLEIDKKALDESKLKNLSTSMNIYADENDILTEDMSFNSNKLTVTIYDNSIQNTELINKFITKEKLEVNKKINKKDDYTKYEFKFSEEYNKNYLEQKMTQTLDVIRNRLNEFGLSEPTVLRNGSDRIIVEIAGVDTVEEEERIIKLITKPSYLQFMRVQEKNKYTIELPDLKNEALTYNVNQVAILDGAMLDNARLGFDQNNRMQIEFEFNSRGGDIFRKFTSKNKGTQLAIVIDNKVYSAPVIQATIGRNGTITGDFTIQEANDLAIAIKSGSSGAKINILEKKTIGASLGEDSVKNGAISLIAGFLIVLMFIIYYYRGYGVIITTALVVNIFMLLAIMALLGATLTLTGIIGIVLTVGMAIDSNIIINERIKELLKQGKTQSKAIQEGYDKAFSTIFDANITTLLVSCILYAYGNTTIKGFAITLSFGIIISMFTAIYGTKNLMLYFIIKQKVVTKTTTKKGRRNDIKL